MNDYNINAVTVRTTGRLHLGFFDMHGGLGRKFGSLGLSLQVPVTALEAHLSDQLAIVGNVQEDERAVISKSLAVLTQVLNLDCSLHIHVKSLIPSHAGLGSGTQIKLALLALIDRLNQLQLGDNRFSEISGRGMRSGIGLATFRHGGVVVDGGRRSSTSSEVVGVPPMIARVDFPSDWRVLLIFDPARQGVHGQNEIEAFRRLPEFSAQSAEMLCRHVLMQALPALHEQDLREFGKAVQVLQRVTGDYFSSAQGGMYASPAVAKVMSWCEVNNVACYGQSSWGPTGFAIFESERVAVDALHNINAALKETQLGFTITSGCNSGAEITTKTNL